VYTALHAFDLSGVKAVTHFDARGVAPRITHEEVAEILRLAEVPPYELMLRTCVEAVLYSSSQRRWNMNRMLLDFYTDYLISSFSQTSATG